MEPDVDYQRKLESVTRELLNCYETLACLYRTAGELTRFEDPGRIASFVLAEGLSYTGATRGAFYGAKGEVVAEEGAPIPRGLWERHRLTGKAFFRNGLPAEEGVANLLVVPVKGTEVELGSLLLADRPEPFTSFELKLAVALSAQGAVALDNARRAAEVMEKNRSLERALAELRAAQEELVQSERLAAIGGMAGRIIHDFKGPITVVAGYAELLEGSAPTLPPDAVRRFARAIRAGGAQLQDLIAEILEFARGGHMALRMEVVPFPGLLEALAGAVEPLVRAAGCRLETALPEEGLVRVDRARLERVLMNLARNAVEATGPGGLVSVRGAVEGEQALLEIGDDGPGIPPARREGLFNPFVTHGKTGGTGLGLAIAKNLVEAHSGTIALLPSTPGARFRITLPLAEVEFPPLPPDLRPRAAVAERDKGDPPAAAWAQAQGRRNR